MHYLKYASDSEGYPNMDFESWYQLGVECFKARLPKVLRKQAFEALTERWLAMDRDVKSWHARAFIYGSSGRNAVERSNQDVDPEYQWPCPPDPSWLLVVCCYPDGWCELDFVHQVSRRFWSEENEFLDPPLDGRSHFNRAWYAKMGFDVLEFDPRFVPVPGGKVPHLRLVV